MTFRALCIWVAQVLVATLSGEALAQTTAPISGRRDGREGLANNAISYADCMLDDRLTVTLTYTAAGTQSLEVWAGTDPGCARRASRVNLGDLCWQVGSQDTATKEVSLRIQDIMAAGGDGTDAACEGRKTEGPLTLYFVLTEGDQDSTVQPSPATVSLVYDLLGPKAPKMKTPAGIGETRLYPKWELSSATDVKNYNIYCEKTGQSGTTTDSACESAILKPGEIPAVELVIRGTTGDSSQSGEADGLENYQQYACAVSATDDMGNAGPLSELACGEPQPVAGYFKGYRAVGGQAGGGYCAFGRVGTAGAAGTALALAALALLQRRSRRAGVSR